MDNLNSAYVAPPSAVGTGQFLPGPLAPIFQVARKRIEAAIVEHCGTGADIERCAGDASQEILGDIIAAAQHINYDGTFAAWKRMPPDLRAAIAKATGGAA